MTKPRNWIGLMIFVFEETLPERNHRALRWGYLFRKYAEILTHKTYLGNLFAGGFSYAGIFAYLGAAPFLLITELHVPVIQYGWYFSMFAVVIGVATFVVPSLAKKTSDTIVLVLGTGLIVISGLLIFILNKQNIIGVWSLTLIMNIFAIGIAFVRVSASTTAVKLFPAQNAGVAGTLFNQAMFLFGAISTAILSIVNDNIHNFSILILTAGLLAFFSSLILCYKKL